jgi:hypothetical protein
VERKFARASKRELEILRKEIDPTGIVLRYARECYECDTERSYRSKGELKHRSIMLGMTQRYIGNE